MILRRFIRFFCLALALGVVPGARNALAQEQAGSPARAAALGLVRMSEQIPQKVDKGHGSFGVWVTLGASRVELDLHPDSRRRPNCEVIEEGPGGVRTKLELPPTKTYRGTVEGD